jgi:hypothetical protein
MYPKPLSYRHRPPRIIQYQVVPKVKHTFYEWVDLQRGKSRRQVPESEGTSFSYLNYFTSNLGDVAHNYHNCFPSQESLLLITIAMAEDPTPNLLAISAIVNLQNVAQFSHFFFEY